MRRFTTRAVAGIAVLLVGCSEGPAPVDLAEARASLQAANQAYLDAIVAKDLEGLLSHYAANSVAYPDGGPTVTGIDGMRTVAEAFLQDPAFVGTFEPAPLEISESGDVGYGAVMGSLTFTGPDGNIVTERLRDVHVWRRGSDGQWKLVIDIWNPVPPAAAQ